jgi:hypothetical protein
MRCAYTAMLVSALALLLLASGVAAQDPTTYLTAYPAQTTTSTYRTHTHAHTRTHTPTHTHTHTHTHRKC